jgi:hypothetical protein
VLYKKPNQKLENLNIKLILSINKTKQRNIMDTILKSAEDKKYTDFSNAVKQEMKTKLSNHPTIKKFTNDFDKIQQMKSAFKKINTDFEEE